MNCLQRSQIQDIKYIKLPRNLKYTDRISMNNNIETRLPFLDPKFQKYLYIKDSHKFNKKYSKYLLRLVLQNRGVPDSITWRTN